MERVSKLGGKVERDQPLTWHSFKRLIFQLTNQGQLVCEINPQLGYHWTIENKHSWNEWVSCAVKWNVISRTKRKIKNYFQFNGSDDHRLNHPPCQNTTHCLSGIKIWEAKFSLGWRSQDSEEGIAERRQRGGGWVKIFYQTRQLVTREKKQKGPE